jgi:hypothetical protein
MRKQQIRNMVKDNCPDHTAAADGNTVTFKLHKRVSSPVHVAIREPLEISRWFSLILDLKSGLSSRQAWLAKRFLNWQYKEICPCYRKVKSTKNRLWAAIAIREGKPYFDDYCREGGYFQKKHSCNYTCAKHIAHNDKHSALFFGTS